MGLAILPAPLGWSVPSTSPSEPVSSPARPCERSAQASRRARATACPGSRVCWALAVVLHPLPGALASSPAPAHRTGRCFRALERAVAAAWNSLLPDIHLCPFLPLLSFHCHRVLNGGPVSIPVPLSCFMLYCSTRAPDDVKQFLSVFIVSFPTRMSSARKRRVLSVVHCCNHRSRDRD